MSVSAVSSISLLEQTLEAIATSTKKTTTTSATSDVSTSTTVASSTSSSADVLTQDMVKLLKALASGDISGAKSDLAKLKADLSAQESTDATNTLGKDVTSFLKDLASGDTSAAKTDLSKVQKDLQSVEASSSSQASNPLDSLISKMADSLSSGDVQGALQTLASYLVQNGQGSGGLVNATA